MIVFLLATTLTCSEAQHVIERVNESRVQQKEELIEVIKLTTKPGCYEGSEHNS